MKLLLSLSLGACLGWWIWKRYSQSRELSPEWLVDHERRQWTEGIDAVCWSWPVVKEE